MYELPDLEWVSWCDVHPLFGFPRTVKTSRRRIRRNKRKFVRTDGGKNKEKGLDSSSIYTCNGQQIQLTEMSDVVISDD